MSPDPSPDTTESLGMTPPPTHTQPMDTQPFRVEPTHEPGHAVDAPRALHEPHLHGQASDGGRGGEEFTAGAASTIVRLMQKNLTNPEAQQESCRFLKDLAHREGDKDLVRANGGVSATIKAMVSHPADAGVQSEACEALRFIVGSSE